MVWLFVVSAVPWHRLTYKGHHTLNNFVPGAYQTLWSLLYLSKNVSHAVLICSDYCNVQCVFPQRNPTYLFHFRRHSSKIRLHTKYLHLSVVSLSCFQQLCIVCLSVEFQLFNTNMEAIDWGRAHHASMDSTSNTYCDQSSFSQYDSNTVRPRTWVTIYRQVGFTCCPVNCPADKSWLCALSHFVSTFGWSGLIGRVDTMTISTLYVRFIVSVAFRCVSKAGFS